MAYVIAEPCLDVKDQACVEVCPVDCIYELSPKDRQLYINPDECIHCGACQPVCPVAAIFSDANVPAKWEHYVELNRKAFEGRP